MSLLKDVPDPWVVLDLPRGERNETMVKAAYKKKSLILHPDKPGGSEEKFKQLQVARDILLDSSLFRKWTEQGKVKPHCQQIMCHNKYGRLVRGNSNNWTRVLTSGDQLLIQDTKTCRDLDLFCEKEEKQQQQHEPEHVNLWKERSPQKKTKSPLKQEQKKSPQKKKEEQVFDFTTYQLMLPPDKYDSVSTVVNLLNQSKIQADHVYMWSKRMNQAYDIQFDPTTKSYSTGNSFIIKHVSHQQLQQITTQIHQAWDLLRLEPEEKKQSSSPLKNSSPQKSKKAEKDEKHLFDFEHYQLVLPPDRYNSVGNVVDLLNERMIRPTHVFMWSTRKNEAYDIQLNPETNLYSTNNSVRLPDVSHKQLQHLSEQIYQARHALGLIAPLRTK